MIKAIVILLAVLFLVLMALIMVWGILELGKRVLEIIRGCRDCIFHLWEPGCWTCNLKKLDLLDMQEIKANIVAKWKEGKGHGRI